MSEVTKKTPKPVTGSRSDTSYGDGVHLLYREYWEKGHIYPFTLADASCHGFPWSVNRCSLTQGEYCSIIPVCLVTRVVSPAKLFRSVFPVAIFEHTISIMIWLSAN